MLMKLKREKYQKVRNFAKSGRQAYGSAFLTPKWYSYFDVIIFTRLNARFMLNRVFGYIKCQSFQDLELLPSKLQRLKFKYF